MMLLSPKSQSQSKRILNLNSFLISKKSKYTPKVSSRNNLLIQSPLKQITSTPLFQSPIKLNSKHLLNQTTTSNIYNTYKKEGDDCINHLCPNLSIILKLKIQIKELMKENIKMKQINEFFLKTLSFKNELISSISNISCIQDRVESLTALSPKSNTNTIKSFSFINDCNTPKKKRNLLEVIQIAIENQKRKNQDRYIIKKASIISNTKVNKLKQQQQQDRLGSKRNFNYFKFLSQPKPKDSNEYYGLIQNLVKNKTQKSNEYNPVTLFLSKDSNALKAMITNEIFIKAKKLTQRKDEFLNVITLMPLEKMTNLCDYIAKVVNEYEQLVTLIIRLKAYISMSINIMMNTNTAPLKYIVTQSLQILQCQRFNIYLFDQKLNLFILNPWENSHSIRIRFPIKNDIIGYTFTKKEKQNVHDVAFDNRFDFELDRELGFDTKTMLCFPLISDDGLRCYGVIQAINKNEKHQLFNSDDEEMMGMIAKVCITTIMKSIQDDTNTKFQYQMRSLINYSIEVNHCYTCIQATSVSERVLAELGGIGKSQIVFIKENKDINNDCPDSNKESNPSANKGIGFYHYDSKNNLLELKPQGLLKKCYDTKKIIMTQCSNEDSQYDRKVDIDSYSIITFPIFDINSSNLNSIGQVGISSLLSNCNNINTVFNDNALEVYVIFARIAGNAISNSNDAFCI